MDRYDYNNLMVNTDGEYGYEYIPVHQLEKLINRVNTASMFTTKDYKGKVRGFTKLWQAIQHATVNRIEIDKAIITHKYIKEDKEHLIVIRQEDTRKFVKIYATKFYNYEV